MTLRRVEIEGFKPFESVILTLDTSGLVFVVGPNNAGKSALLAAFDVIANTLPGTASDRNVHSTATRIRATFEFPEEWRAAYFAALSSATADREVLDSQLARQVRWTFELAAPGGPFLTTSVDVKD